MTIRDVLEHARILLNKAEIDDAALEAEVLLRYLLKADRTFLFSNPDLELTEEQLEICNGLMLRRCSGEPTAYITGVREFYGRVFHVTPAVLIPRPETEHLVEEAIQAVQELGYTEIADIGTGSGCISITLVLNLPHIKVCAVDISPEALAVAEENAAVHGVSGRIMFCQGDLLSSVAGPVDMIVANLPYINANDLKSVNTFGFEPVAALDGGPDGLDFIRRLIEQSGDRLAPGGTILLEVGYDQAEAVCLLLRKAYPGEEPRVIKDLAGIDRVVGLTLSRDSRLFS